MTDTKPPSLKRPPLVAATEPANTALAPSPTAAPAPVREPVQAVTLYIPESAHLELKILAARQKTNMVSLIRTAINEQIFAPHNLPLMKNPD